MAEQIINITVDSQKTLRADQYIAWKMDITRSALQKRLIKNSLSINGKNKSFATMVKENDQICFTISEKKEISLAPQNIPLEVIFEDNNTAVINKQPGLTVHAGGGAYDNTLVNALMYHFKEICEIDDKIRPGIVHRLDKDTSGVIIVAKNDKALTFLQRQFAERKVIKEYHAIVSPPLKEGTVEVKEPIGRDQKNRKRMAVNGINPRFAHSIFHVEKQMKNAQLIRAEILTGRTHQIRVHLKYLKSPILGDQLYGIKSRFNLSRLMLHASKLSIILPGNNYLQTFEAPLPADMENFISKFS